MWQNIPSWTHLDKYCIWKLIIPKGDIDLQSSHVYSTQHTANWTRHAILRYFFLFNAENKVKLLHETTIVMDCHEFYICLASKQLANKIPEKN